MPTLVCRACGRVVYTTAPLDALFTEERRCPRCGAFLDTERREGSRRQSNRRTSGGSAKVPPPGGLERRAAERRSGKRRRDDHGPYQG